MKVTPYIVRCGPNGAQWERAERAGDALRRDSAVLAPTLANCSCSGDGPRAVLTWSVCSPAITYGTDCYVAKILFAVYPLLLTKF